MPDLVESVQLVPADDATVLLRLAGRSDAGELASVPVLRVGHDGGAELRIAALPGPLGPPDGTFTAAFAVPRDVLLGGDGPLTVEVGDARHTLPRIVPGPEARPLLGPLGPVPGRAPRTPATPAAEAGAAPAASAQVLVVDDDPLVQLAVAATLEREGCSVTTADDGTQALDRVAEALPDLIVSDVMMPDMDGLSLVERLREDPATQRIPLIFLTSRRRAGDVAEALELGADDYLSKPFRPEELAARVRAKLERRPVPAELLRHDPRTGVLSAAVLRDELAREIERTTRGGAPGCLAVVELDELRAVRSRLGDRAVDAVARRLAGLVADPDHPLDAVGRLGRGRFALLLPETSERDAERRLETLSRTIVRAPFEVEGERLRFTPTIGFTGYDRADAAAGEAVERRADAALRSAASHLDVRAARFEPAMLAAAAAQDAEAERTRPSLLSRLATPLQIAFTQLLGLVAPFAAYWGLDAAGVDVTWPIYLVVVGALLVTALTIWMEGFTALRRPEPPAEAGAPAPPATAIIAAYLPNEAATIVETVESFLAQEYEADLQVLLAYNTPHRLPIEDELQELADRDGRLTLFKVEHSTSKAQNVNAALAAARGEVIGVFDADHQPAPGAFDRAWRWLSNGFDVVQGHCVVRNGDVSWVARTVAVEFESIYAVSHPGRARLHDFGIFGGTNGFWKADLLREIRMRGSMLTEDIDSSMRVVEEGGRIASDPGLVSRELAPASLRALWNQRMRWAQGWFQVSMQHLWRGLRSPKLSVRQKVGLFYLLGWREIYPWISLQMFPLVAFWITKGGRVDWLVPLFVATSLFTLGTGPGQTLFAYRLADPEIRRRGRWFVLYLLVASVFFTEFKNVVARVAQIKEIAGDRQWKVTPRG